MNSTELKIYGLEKTKDTEEASYVSGEEVYEVIGEDQFLVSTYDFLRKISLPKGIWGIYKHHNEDGLYNVHISQTMLFDNPDSIKWCVNILKLQIYLKEEFDD